MNQEQYDLLCRSVADFNQWRLDHPEETVDLSSADLAGASLQGAWLMNVDLTGANLEGANLEEAILCRARLQEANLKESHLEKAILGPPDEVADSLADTELAVHLKYGVSAEGANFSKAHLVEANCREGYFQKADFSHANLRGASLQNANLEGANVEEAHFEETHLQGANITGTLLQAMWCFQQGQTHYNDGDYQAALDFFQQAVEIAPRYVNPHFLTGMTCQQLEMWEHGIKAFEKVLELQPDEGEARFNMATMKYHLERYDDAIEEMEKALEMGLSENTPAQAYFNLGIFAIESVNPHGVDPHRYDRAFDYFDKCLQENPKFMAVHFHRGKLYLRLEKFGEALESLATLREAFDDVSDHPMVIESWVGTALAHNGLGEFEETLACLEKCFALDSSLKEMAREDPLFDPIRKSDYGDRFEELVGES